MCVRARACSVRACVRACVRVCVYVCMRVCACMRVGVARWLLWSLCRGEKREGSVRDSICVHTDLA